MRTGSSSPQPARATAASARARRAARRRAHGAGHSRMVPPADDPLVASSCSRLTVLAAGACSPPAAQESIELDERRERARSARARQIFNDKLLGLPHARARPATAGLGHQRPRPRAHRRPELQHPAARRSTPSSTRSATAASPARSCPRTSSSARRPRRSPSTSRSTPGATPRSRSRPDARRDTRVRGPEPCSTSSASGASPTPCGTALARRGVDAAVARPRARARRAPPRGRRRASRRCAPSRTRRSQAIGAREEGRRGRVATRSREMQEVAGAGQGARRRARRASSASCERCSSRCRTSPDPDAPPEDTVVREVGEARRRPAATTSSSPASASTWSAARGCRGSRFAYLRGDLVFLELALVRWALDKLAGHGFEPVIPPVLVREEALYGTGMLPDTEQQIYRLADDDLYLVGTSEVALASLHAGEILDGGDAAAPLRRLLAVLPPRGGRRGQGHARHLPRPPVRQGRDVRVRRARGVGGRARAAAGHRGGDPQRARHPLPRRRHRGRRPRRQRRAEVRLRGVAARPGALPRADVDARTRPTSRRGASTIRMRPRGRQARDAAHAQRHRGRGRPHDHRRCWRTASATTARS